MVALNMARESMRPERAIEWSFASRPSPGETVSGDRHLVQLFSRGVLVAVVDGLGHGQEATTAAQIAITVLTGHPEESLTSLVKRCHEAMARTRGATMTVASLNLFDRTMTWLGVGSVEGHLLRADPKVTPNSESVLLRGGVVGYQLPPRRSTLSEFG